SLILLISRTTATVLFPYTTLFRSVIKHGFDGAAVGDLLEPFGFDDLVGIAFTFGHGLEHHLGDLAGNGVVLDTQNHAAQLAGARSEEHTSELQSRENLVCRLLLEK